MAAAAGRMRWTRGLPDQAEAERSTSSPHSGRAPMVAWTCTSLPRTTGDDELVANRIVCGAALACWQHYSYLMPIPNAAIPRERIAPGAAHSRTRACRHAADHNTVRATTLPLAQRRVAARKSAAADPAGHPLLPPRSSIQVEVPRCAERAQSCAVASASPAAGRPRRRRCTTTTTNSCIAEDVVSGVAHPKAKRG